VNNGGDWERILNRDSTEGPPMRICHTEHRIMVYWANGSDFIDANDSEKFYWYLDKSNSTSFISDPR